MGYKTANDFMDYGPAMTTAEWKAMVVLASDARDDTRVTFRPVTADEIMQRIRLSPKAWTNLRGDLVRKGFLEVVESGRKGCCAKYRIPDYPKIGHPLGDESGSEDEMRHPGGDPFGPTDHDGVVPEDSMGHPAGDESGPIHHPAGDASAVCVTQEVPPTYYPSLLEQITYETSLSPRAAASPAAVPTNERETIREEAEPQPEGPQARPQEQRPARELNSADVIDVYVEARRDVGQPATATERVRLRAAVVELASEGHAFEYLIRLADWMGRKQPGWTDIARARTAPGAPALIPGQRDQEARQDKPCAPGACDGHDHPTCDLGWMDIDDRLTHCPCWSTPMTKPGGYQTFQQPTDMSIYYDPKTKPKPDHVGFKNSTDPADFEGTF